MYEYQKNRITYYESEDIRQPAIVEKPEQPKAKFCAIM